MARSTGKGTREDPWVLKTPSGQSEFRAFRDEALILAEVEHNPKNNRMRAR